MNILLLRNRSLPWAPVPNCIRCLILDNDDQIKNTSDSLWSYSNTQSINQPFELKYDSRSFSWALGTRFCKFIPVASVKAPPNPTIL